MKSFLTCALVAFNTIFARGEVGCFLKRTSFNKNNKFQEGDKDSPNKYRYEQAKKPFPSLTQCYKNNQLSCCVSAHDSYIASVYGSILSATCLREYEHLENYFCLGCYPQQADYLVAPRPLDDAPTSTTELGATTTTAAPPTDYLVDEDGKGIFTMRICKSFAKMLYNPEENSGSSYTYDNCGLLDMETGKGYLPKERYANYSQFIEALKPPYFENVKWVVIDDALPNHRSCFSAATSFRVGIMAFVIGLLAHLLH